jgi:pyruvate kinase
MVAAGMNVARLNFSHGSHEDHAKVVNTLREIARELRRPMAILADLCGPKLRLGKMQHERMLERGAEVTLVVGADVVDDSGLESDELPTPVPELIGALSANSSIMLADGAIRLRVKDVDIPRARIRCLVEDGGPVSSGKGINVPDVELGIPTLTPKDIEDLAFALEQGVDYVAQSFVRSPDDIEQLRALIAQAIDPNGSYRPQIIAKIERRVAVERLDDILAASDAVMVARGDLGVELGAAEVPLVQKRMIRSALELGIPVITATQMLESMITSPEPTRAEASDVANAILDGTSAVMLSAETAVGRFPVETVRTMDKIARAVEPATPLPTTYLEMQRTTSIPQALSDVACEIGELLGAAAIVVLTETGKTARQVSKNRPHRAVIAASRNVHTCRRLALDWGTVPVLIDEMPHTEENWGHSSAAVRVSGLIKPGERVVFTAGTIKGRPGMTNMLKVEEWISPTSEPDSLTHRLLQSQGS